MYKNKLSMLEISIKIGCSDVTVARILRQNNIEIRPYIENNVKQWKDNIVVDRKIFRDSHKYKEWLMKCYTISNNISCVSGLKEDNQCHHIYGFRFILKSSLAKYKNIPPYIQKIGIISDERFYDIDNGLILTKKEHEKIEYLGRKSHYYWRMWKYFPEFALKKFNFTEGQYLSLNADGQLNAQDAIISESRATEEIKKIIRYEHYLGTIPPYKFILVSQVNGIIAGIAIFGKGANKNIPKGTLELLRLCVPYYVVRHYTINFLNQCIKYIQDNYPELKQIIAYSDPNVGHDGAIYRMAGWKKEGKTSPSYCYFDPNINQLKHKSYCRRIKGVDKTEIELATERGLIRIPLLPKRKYSIILNQYQLPPSKQLLP